MSVMDGVRLVGSGPRRVVVVHGWMAAAALFDPMHGWLDGERFTYAFMDCRGYGARLEEPGPFTVVQIALDILTLADELRWERFSVVGHSMAGMSAQWLLANAARRLDSVVLLAAVPASGAGVSSERRTLLNNALRDPEVRLSLISTNVGLSRPEEWLRRILALSLHTTWPEAMNAYMTSWIDDNFASTLHGVRVPALVLVGELDPGCTARFMEETVMRWLADAHLQILPGVGHYPMQESPRALTQTIEAWLLSDMDAAGK
ncbi:3-oxoadipate enol-lactonase 2 [compost metagenome]